MEIACEDKNEAINALREKISRMVNDNFFQIFMTYFG